MFTETAEKWSSDKTPSINQTRWILLKIKLKFEPVFIGSVVIVVSSKQYHFIEQIHWITSFGKN